MKAVVIDQEPRLVTVPDPEPIEGQVLVRVRMAAITGLDIDVVKGNIPFHGTPGNAFVGVVEEYRGSHARPLQGRRVIARGSHGCGACEVCLNGMEYRCVDRVRPGIVGAAGGHAEYVVLPSRSVVPVPDSVSDRAAVLVPMLAGIYSAVSRAGLSEWTNILVLGDGGAGLLSAIALSAAGYTVTVRGRHGNRFDLLRRHNINFNLVNDDSELEGTRPGRYGPALMSYPYVVEATGHPSGWLAAVELAGPGGVIFALSSCGDRVPRPVHRIQEKNVRVIGLREGPLEATLGIVAQGLFDPAHVISRAYPLDEAIRAYKRLRTNSDEWLAVLEIGE